MKRVMCLCMSVLCLLSLMGYGQAPTVKNTTKKSTNYKQASPSARYDSLKPGIVVQCQLLTGSITQASKINIHQPYVVETVERPVLADYLKNFTFPGKVPFLASLHGLIDIKESKTYLFKIRSSDGSALYIDNQLIATTKNKDGMEEAEVEKFLEAGLHDFRITYFKNDPVSYKEITLWWFNPTKSDFEYIPAQYFFHYSSTYRTLAQSKKPLPLDDLAANLDAPHPAIRIKKVIPHHFKPKVGGMDFHPSGDLVICTWDSAGAVYRIKNVTSGDTNQIKIKRIACGLAEPLGLKVVEGRIFVLQKQELTELIDHDGDEVADEYKTICNSWGATGNFHEFAFGLAYKDGYFYAGLAIAIQPGGKSTIPQHKDRGKIIKIGLDGSLSFEASGLRTPNGINTAIDNEIFVADNQGDWLPSCKVIHLKKGAFYGNYSVDYYAMGTKKEQPPVVWLPQNEIGNSTTQPILLNRGAYKNQLLVGDVTHGGLKRIFVEKIKGDYQGCVFPFSQGFMAGTNRLAWGPDGKLYVGMIGNPGNWGQTGKAWHGIESVEFTDAPVFEILEVRAMKNGFELHFSEPVATSLAELPSTYSIEQWRYEPTYRYGGPKLDLTTLPINGIYISKDRKIVYLHCTGLKEQHVCGISVSPKLKSMYGREIWQGKAYYTLNQLPEYDSPLYKNSLKSTAVTKSSSTTTSKPMQTSGSAASKLTKKEINDMIAAGGLLLKPSGCLACHKLDEKVLGPAFKDVAARYNNDEATVRKLIEKVYNGGGGVWGDYEMAGQTHVSKADIEKMVRYILSLK